MATPWGSSPHWLSAIRSRKNIRYILIGVAVVLAVLAAACAQLTGHTPPVEDKQAPPQGQSAPGEDASEPSSQNAPLRQDEGETEQPPVSDFADTLFLGNSRMEGFLLYAGVEDAVGFAARGASVRSFYSQEDVQVGESMVTMEQAARQAGSFGKVYLLFGMNELGWPYREVFLEEYGGLIDLVAQLNPQADIYIQSVLPVTAEKSAEGNFTREKIDEMNAQLSQLAQDKGVYYLDVNSVLADEEGYLQPQYSGGDGIHLTKEACQQWRQYLSEHIM